MGQSAHRLDAAIFDMDGTLVLSLELQRTVWQQVFDELLAARLGDGFRPFDTPDYRAYVDGRARVDGVRTFLGSRGLSLPEGDRDDPPEAQTVYGLANRKTALFRARLEQGAEVRADPDAVALVGALRAAGVKVGLATASEDADALVSRAGLDGVFDLRLDEAASQGLRLRGKPHADLLLACLEQLGCREPAAAAVFDDAIVGADAAREGGFGPMVGIDRGGNATALREHGAEWIVESFREVSVDCLLSRFAR